MKINTLLMHIVKELNSFGFVNVGVAPDPTTGLISVSTTVTDRSVFVFASTNEPIPEITKPFCISNMGMLSSIMNYEAFRDGVITEATVATAKDGTQYTPAFNFVNGKSKTHYRMGTPSEIPRIPRLLEPPKWDVELTVTDVTVKKLSQAATIFAAVDTHVTPIITDNELCFVFGSESASTHNGCVSFDTYQAPDQRFKYRFPVKMMIAAMSIPNATVTLKILGTGTMLIEATTDTMKYKFGLPGWSS